jgi:hydrogenase maturation protein HypF
LSHLSRAIQRYQIIITGQVQGVGFRPFVYRLARSYGLTGWIKNTEQGVVIEVEGAIVTLQRFLQQLQQNPPLHATIISCEWRIIPPCQDNEFSIYSSDCQSNTKTALILPDLALCPACFSDIFTPQNRRYQYPFTSCTHCGPRYSIIQGLPYDRPQTTMAQFTMCPDCQREYDNPDDRRFHAQPIACTNCGPQLQLWDRGGNVLADRQTAIFQAAAAVQAGKILALKGLGGFHLIVDAQNPAAVQQLRQRKHRPDKPFAVMFASLAQVQEYCQINPAEMELLTSSSAPIVLLKQKTNVANPLADAVAPYNPLVGAMLPYTPLHALLMAELGVPVVATSGNSSGLPICADEQVALQDLGEIADIFLVYDRPIVQPIDDAIVQVIAHQPMLLREGRGYAPLYIPCQDNLVILAMGGHLKNTVALLCNQQILVSQHLGDLDTLECLDRYTSTIQHLLQIYNVKPQMIACDAHPDYASTKVAQTLSASIQPPPTIVPVQHHYAHVLAGMIDNQLAPPVLGIAWDGTGYGLDNTIWGGEFLRITASGFDRVAHLRTFPLPGGEVAIQEPRRAALGLLYEYWGDRIWEWQDLPPLQAFSRSELAILQTSLKQGINCPRTSSMGRLFDTIAALLGYCQKSSFEGQAAMQLEFAVTRAMTDAVYPYYLNGGNHAPIVIDYSPMLTAILEDIRQEVANETIVAKFHHTLIETMVEVCKRSGMSTIVLTGGCYQNRYLLERAIKALSQAGFSAHWHHQIPPNDGGLSLGQILGAIRCQSTHQGDQPCV